VHETGVITPGAPELEYRIPAGANSVEEVKRYVVIMKADLA
jgi:hypothetical protein